MRRTIIAAAFALALIGGPTACGTTEAGIAATPASSACDDAESASIDNLLASNKALESARYTLLHPTDSESIERTTKLMADASTAADKVTTVIGRVPADEVCDLTRFQPAVAQSSKAGNAASAAFNSYGTGRWAANRDAAIKEINSYTDFDTVAIVEGS